MKSLYLPSPSHLVFQCTSRHPEEAGRLIDTEAWADAALALMELERPLWHVRRIGSRMQIRTFKNNLEHAVTATILTVTLSLVWGAVPTVVITLAAYGLGV